MQGILVTPVDPDSPVLADIAGRGTPLVIVDRTRPGAAFCTVSVDDVLGGRLAVDHLIDRGHRRVAFVGGPDSLGQVRERLEGARQAWREAGLPDDDLVVVPTTALSVAEGRAPANGSRDCRRAAARPPSSAPTTCVALGLLQQATSAGVQVPDDLAIVGFDDIDFAAAAAVPLTSVRQPRAELGRTAARLLLAEADDPDHVHEQVVFEPELVARRSTLA